MLAICFCYAPGRGRASSPYVERSGNVRRRRPTAPAREWVAGDRGRRARFASCRGLIRVLSISRRRNCRARCDSALGTPLVAALAITFATVLLVRPCSRADRRPDRCRLHAAARLTIGTGFESEAACSACAVSMQTTLALIMLAGSALLARSLARLESIDLGYQAEHLSILAASWPTTRYDSVSKLYSLGEELCRTARRRCRRDTGAHSAARR